MEHPGDDQQKMPITEHLEELRKRIIYSVAAILVITAVAFFLSNKLLNVLLLPSGGMHLNAFSLMDGFMIKWRIALYAGVAIAFPVWGSQIYLFIKPGLYEQEQRAIFPILLGSLVLFILGVFFGYYLLWGMIRVMKEFFPPEVTFLPAADDYISFVLFFLLACGLAFQLPALLIILAQLKILDSNFLRKQRKYSYFVLFVFAEIITPVSDPIVAPLTVMVPLVLLYELSIWVTRRIEKGRAKATVQITPLS